MQKNKDMTTFQNFLLIDGSNLLFQMFYGMPSRIVNHEGIQIHGVIGFMGALIRMIREFQPTHLAVIFDGECENDRRNLDTEYKGNRLDFSSLPEDETPFSQIQYIYKALDFLGIKHTEVSSGEADDVIASYAVKFSPCMNVIISSFDSDFFQLINDSVSVYRYRGKSSYMCDVNYIKEKFGILPSQYAYLKSLTGDASDNVKGIKGIGIKTASSLLREFETLENIISNVCKISKPSVKEAVKNGIERIRINYKLIYLSGESVLPFDVDSLSYVYGGEGTNEILKKINLIR